MTKKRISYKVAAFVLLAAVTAFAAGKGGTPAATTAQQPVQLQIGDYILLGKYYDEPILWRCIDVDEHGPLMLSDKLIAYKSFSSAVNGFYYWDGSHVRTWLNSSESADNIDYGVDEYRDQVEQFIGKNNFNVSGYFRGLPDYSGEDGFLSDKNFSQTERSVLKEVSQPLIAVKTFEREPTQNSTPYTLPDVPGYPDGSDYYTDKVFLLDIEQYYELREKSDLLGEYYIAEYTQQVYDTFLTDGSEQGEPIKESLGNSYFLRTTHLIPANPRDSGGYKPCYVIAANAQRLADAYIEYSYGIRPAFYLDEATAQILSGSGTEDDPYVVDGKKNDSISVYVNGTELTFDVPPMLENDRTLVPMRAIFEALGAEVSWYPEDRTIVAVRGGTTVFMQVDDWYMSVNDEWIALDAPPRIVNDRTLIPLRAVAEAFGAQVGWDEATQTVTVELY